MSASGEEGGERITGVGDEMGLKYLVLLCWILVNAGWFLWGFEGWGFGRFCLGGYLGTGIGGVKEDGGGFVVVGAVVGREEKRLWFGSEARIAICRLESERETVGGFSLSGCLFVCLFVCSKDILAPSFPIGYRKLGYFILLVLYMGLYYSTIGLLSPSILVFGISGSYLLRYPILLSYTRIYMSYNGTYSVRVIKKIKYYYLVV